MFRAFGGCFVMLVKGWLKGPFKGCVIEIFEMFQNLSYKACQRPRASRPSPRLHGLAGPRRHRPTASRAHGLTGPRPHGTRAFANGPAASRAHGLTAHGPSPTGPRPYGPTASRARWASRAHGPATGPRPHGPGRREDQRPLVQLHDPHGT